MTAYFLGRHLWSKTIFPKILAIPLLYGAWKNGLWELHWRDPSRGAVLGLVCAVLVLVGLRYGRKGMGWAILLAAAAILLLPSSLLQRALKTEDPFSRHRPLLWQASVQVALEKPWGGVGLGEFKNAYLRHNFAVPTQMARYGRYSTHAHSEPLQSAAELGWPCALLLWGILLKRWWGIRSHPPSFAAATSLLVQSAIDGIFMHPVTLSFLALWMARKAQEDQLPPADSPSTPTLARWIALGMLLGISTGFSALSMQDRVRQDPNDPFLKSRLAQAYLLERPPEIGPALLEIKKARQLAPTHAPFWIQEAQIYRHLQEWERTESLSRMALRREPHFVGAWLLLAEANLKKGNKEAARRFLRRAHREAQRWDQERPHRTSGLEEALSFFDPGLYERIQDAL